MFNSLLNVMSVDAMILDVFIILGVVIAAALIVYLLWEAVSSFINSKDKGSQELNLGEKKKEIVNDSLVVDYSLDAQQEDSLIDERKMEEVDEVKAEEENVEIQNQISEEERVNAERRAYLEARRQELINRMKAETEEKEEEPEVEEEPEEPVEEVDALADEKKALADEKARYEAMVKELENAKRAVEETRREMEEKREEKIEPVYVPVQTNGVLSLDELKAKLAEAEDKLKATEKEFRQCKKEFIPLRKVWTTHERDEKKLRRKEALVAKQKVILYGVNNYADIDEEKAKKLAEDLDLLDGLKLSVQHCEEVMKKNEERYPLLEKMYNVLKARNDELKSDIAYYKEEIAKLEAEGTEEN